MKRVLLLIMIVIEVFAMVFYVSAEESEDPYDSLNIPQEIIEKLPEHESAEVIYRIYLESPRGKNWGEYIDVNTMAECLEGKSVTYAVIISGVEKYYKIDEDGVAVQTGEYTFVGDEIRFRTHHFLTREAICAVSPDIQIESAYCLYYPFFTIFDEAIFYKTNMGDFVLFRTENIEPMLMTIRRFGEYLKAWKEYQKVQEELYGTMCGGRYTLKLDFSAYDWNSPNFDPGARLPISESEKNSYSAYYWFGGGVVVLVGIVTVGIIITRRKKEEEEVFEDT